jgi:hypothetical protein
VALGDLGDEACGGFDVAEVGGAAGADAVGFGGGADADEDEVGAAMAGLMSVVKWRLRPRAEATTSSRPGS